MDQKKVLMIFLSLLLISSVFLGFAQQEEEVESVREMIAALPTPEQLRTLDTAAQQEAYLATQAAYDTYLALGPYEQGKLQEELKTMEALFAYFNTQIMPLAE